MAVSCELRDQASPEKAGTSGDENMHDDQPSDSGVRLAYSLWLKVLSNFAHFSSLSHHLIMETTADWQKSWQHFCGKAPPPHGWWRDCELHVAYLTPCLDQASRHGRQQLRLSRLAWWEKVCTLGFVRSSCSFFRYSCVRHKRVPSSVYTRIGSARLQRFRENISSTPRRSSGIQVKRTNVAA